MKFIHGLAILTAFCFVLGCGGSNTSSIPEGYGDSDPSAVEDPVSSEDNGDSAPPPPPL